MPIINYPDRRHLVKSLHLATLKLPPVQKSVSGKADTNAEALSVIVNSNHPWRLKSVQIGFSNSNSRDYTLGIVSGLTVVEGANDHLWIQHTSSMWEKIVIPEGFYDAEMLADALEDALNANEKFDELGLSFTVEHDSDTGIFSIEVSSGEIRYIQKARTKLNISDSIAGHLFGFTEDTGFASTIEGDTPILGLGVANPVIPLSLTTGATNLHHYHDDVHELTIDQAVVLESSIADLEVEYVINYEVFEHL